MDRQSDPNCTSDERNKVSIAAANFLPLVPALIPGKFARRPWPHLRGPNYDGYYQPRLIWLTPGLLRGPPVLWTRGQGHSGFIVVGKRCYTQYQTPLTSSYFAWISNLELLSGRHATIPTGKRGATLDKLQNPTWAGRCASSLCSGGTVACFDAATGLSLWSLNVREKFNGLATVSSATPPRRQSTTAGRRSSGRARGGLVALSITDGHWSGPAAAIRPATARRSDHPGRRATSIVRLPAELLAAGGCRKC